jgi:hypothetical protein
MWQFGLGQPTESALPDHAGPSVAGRAVFATAIRPH